MIPSDDRDKFLADSGTALFNGNELLVKGAFETPGGVHLLTGYPGSPVATFFDILGKLRDILREKGVCAHIANNEAVSIAMVNGTQMAPLRAMTVFKSVGGHVASDGLALGNLAGAHPQGGAVVVFGDDPWSDSTQVPADSRYLCQHLRMFVLEPSTCQEVKDFVPLAFRLSQASGLYAGYIMTTTLADGGASVRLGPNHWPEQSMNNPGLIRTDTLDPENTVLLPPRTGKKEVGMPERVERLLAEAEQAGVNVQVGPAGKAKVGFVTCGVAWQHLRAALSELGLADKFPILKLGMTYPLSDRQVAEFAANVEYLVVVEERRGFLEQQVAEVVGRVRQLNPGTRFGQVWGKRFPSGHEGFPAVLGLHPSIVIEKLVKLFRLVDQPLASRMAAKFEESLATIRQTSSVRFAIPSRTPTFCPGCPHRDSSNVLLEICRQFMDAKYMRRKHRCGPVDLVFHGDTGCYTMLMFAPNERLMHNYSGMGLGGATGAGIDPFITNKQVVFMGDSTFFHSGQIAISNSIKAGQDITYIILDNRTTAMTGHQPTPGVEEDVLGNLTPRQDIEKIVRAVTAMGGASVVRVDPSNHKRYKKLLEKTIVRDGVKVIVADKECGILTLRRKLDRQRAEQRKTGFLARETFTNVTPELCEHCLECTRLTGCPGLTTEQTVYGPKTAIDLSWCVNDGLCEQIGACPSFEQVEVIRRRPPRPRGHQIKFERIPEPKTRAVGGVWRAYVAGIGGMGIGLATTILVRAGAREGYRIAFADKKGLAIRNGGVYSQLAFYKDTSPQCQVMPYGSADLLLGLDIVEAARAIHGEGLARIASRSRTAAVVNTDKMLTINALCGREDFDPKDMETHIRAHTRSDAFYAHNVTAMCERLFGTKRYANITLLGLAYQLGLIPVSLENIEWAITQSLPAEFKSNLRAFNLGRKLVAHPGLFAEKTAPKNIARIVREKANILERTRLGGSTLARQYKYLVYTTLRRCRDLDKDTMTDVARYLYELIQYEGLAYAQRYAARLRQTYVRDLKKYDFAVTRAVARNLFRLMLVKDEFYVAHVLTSYEKQRRDNHRYNVNAANGDRIRYRRTFHPRFFGLKVSFRVPHWTMYLLKNLRFVRKHLPFYHREDRQFLAWFEQIVDGFDYRDQEQYRRYQGAVEAVDQVKGYREFRTPTMAKARREAIDHLHGRPGSSGPGESAIEPPKLQMPMVSGDAGSLSGRQRSPIISRLMKMLQIW